MHCSDVYEHHPDYPAGIDRNSNAIKHCRLVSVYEQCIHHICSLNYQVMTPSNLEKDFLLRRTKLVAKGKYRLLVS